MPQYLISVWHDEEYVVDFSGPDMQRMVQQVGAFNDELMANGQWVFGAGLNPASTATTARFAGGEVTLTDGPFAETKEQMGGFWVVELPDDEAARALARRAAAACEGSVELRAFQAGPPD